MAKEKRDVKKDIKVGKCVRRIVMNTNEERIVLGASDHSKSLKELSELVIESLKKQDFVQVEYDFGNKPVCYTFYHVDEDLNIKLNGILIVADHAMEGDGNILGGQIFEGLHNMMEMDAQQTRMLAEETAKDIMQDDFIAEMISGIANRGGCNGECHKCGR